MSYNSAISIHALREEGDASRPNRRRRPRNFYPRPPRGGRPAALLGAGVSISISIHALREEGDLWGMGHVVIAAAISIHALREEGDPKPSRGGIRL